MLTETLRRLQLDSADEQAAAIRRELDGRMQKVAEMERVSERDTEWRSPSGSSFEGSLAVH